MQRRIAWLSIVVLAACASGCGEEPDADDLMTVVDLQQESGTLAVGAGNTLSLTPEIRFRDWYTASIIVELRTVDAIDVDALQPLLTGGAVDRAQAWEAIMAQSTSVALSERLMVGYPSLIRRPTLELDVVPGSISGTAFLVGYLALVEEERMPGGEEVVVIDPLDQSHGVLNDVRLVAVENAP